MAESVIRKNNTALLNVGADFGYLEGLNNEVIPLDSGRLVRPRPSIPGVAENVFTTVGAGERCRKIITVANVYAGQDIYYRVPVGDYLLVRQCRAGDVVMLRLRYGTIVEPGDYLVTYNSGQVEPYTVPVSDKVIVGYSNESVDRTVPGVNSRFSATLL